MAPHKRVYNNRKRNASLGPYEPTLTIPVYVSVDVLPFQGLTLPQENGLICAVNAEAVSPEVEEYVATSSREGSLGLTAGGFSISYVSCAISKASACFTPTSFCKSCLLIVNLASQCAPITSGNSSLFKIVMKF